MILNIETSSKYCSVALSDSGEIMFSLSSDSEMDHSVKLAPFVEECLIQLKRHDRKLDAVAVSMGPGSYTGLRIGLSLAKGLCFGLNIPLIGVSTLELMAVKALFSIDTFVDDLLFIPMIDARRMEVYTAAYLLDLKPIMEPQPLILTENSYEEYKDYKLVMIGDGVNKAKTVLTVPVMKYIDRMPVASDMTALSERAFRNKEFLDLAYSTPFYLKNFQATKPKNLFDKIN